MKRLTKHSTRVMLGAAAALLLLTPVAGGRLTAQQDATVKLLQELTDANAAPGFEGPVRTILRREWQGLVKDLRTDGLGNLLATLPGSGESPRVLLMAHMDEVGFMVRYIDPNGFVYFHPVGGYIDQSVLTQRFTITTPRGLQYTAVTSYGQDGSALQRAGTGIPAVNIGVPTRYGHSQSGVIDRADYDAALKLVVKMIQKLSAAEVKAITDFSAM